VAAARGQNGGRGGAPPYRGWNRSFGTGRSTVEGVTSGGKAPSHSSPASSSPNTTAAASTAGRRNIGFGASSAYRLVVALVSLAVVAVALFVVYRTTLGLKLRASIDNRDMAAVLGIPPRLMIAGTFAVGTTLAVLAGALQSPVLGLTPGLGVAFLAPAFFAVLVVRPGSLAGPVAGALVVALLSSLLRRYFTETVADLFFFAALVVLIAVRPAGLSWRLPRWSSTRSRQVA